MSESQRPPRKPSVRPGGRPPTTAAPPRAPREEIVRVGAARAANDLATVTKTIAALRQRLADSEAKLVEEQRERENDAETIAKMLVRISELDRAVREHDRKPTLEVPAVKHDALADLAQRDALEARLREAVARAEEAEHRLSRLQTRHAEVEEQLLIAERRTEASEARLESTTRDLAEASDASDVRMQALEARAHAAERRALDAEARVTQGEIDLAAVRGGKEESAARVAELQARAAELEEQLVAAVQRAEDAEGRIGNAESDLAAIRAESRELEERTREAESRADSLQTEHVATTARAHEDLELARMKVEALETSRDETRRALDEEREAHVRALEDLRQRSEGALAAERQRAGEQTVRVLGLEESLRATEARTRGQISTLERQLEAITFDRDVADRQLSLVRAQLDATEAKLERIDKELDATEDAASAAPGLLTVLETHAQALMNEHARLADALNLIRDRVGTARGEIWTPIETNVLGSVPPPKPVPSRSLSVNTGDIEVAVSVLDDAASAAALEVVAQAQAEDGDEHDGDRPSTPPPASGTVDAAWEGSTEPPPPLERSPRKKHRSS